MAAPDLYGFTEPQMERIGRVVRGFEGLPDDKSRGDSPANWQIVAVTGAAVSGYYPGRRYMDLPSGLAVQSSAIWIKPLNGETLSVGTYYHAKQIWMYGGVPVFRPVVTCCTSSSPSPSVSPSISPSVSASVSVSPQPSPSVSGCACVLPSTLYMCLSGFTNRTNANGLYQINRLTDVASGWKYLGFYATPYLLPRYGDDTSNLVWTYVYCDQNCNISAQGKTGNFTWSAGNGTLAGILDTDITVGNFANEPGAKVRFSTSPIAPCTGCGTGYAVWNGTIWQTAVDRQSVSGAFSKVNYSCLNGSVSVAGLSAGVSVGDVYNLACDCGSPSPSASVSPSPSSSPSNCLTTGTGDGTSCANAEPMTLSEWSKTSVASNYWTKFRTGCGVDATVYIKSTGNWVLYSDCSGTFYSDGGPGCISFPIHDSNCYYLKLTDPQTFQLSCSPIAACSPSPSPSASPSVSPGADCSNAVDLGVGASNTSAPPVRWYKWRPNVSGTWTIKQTSAGPNANVYSNCPATTLIGTAGTSGLTLTLSSSTTYYIQILQVPASLEFFQ